MEKEQELNGYILQDCEKSSGKIKIGYRMKMLQMLCRQVMHQRSWLICLKTVWQHIVIS